MHSKLLTNLLAGLLFLVSLSASASGGNVITGFVADKDSQPIIGAGVHVHETGMGVVTDLDGKFSIKAEPGQTLIVSCLGYADYRFKVGDKTHYEIVLMESSDNLDDAVVVGYGVQKKATLSGSVASVGGENIVRTKNENIQNALTGRIAGLRVVQRSSEPGKFDTSFNIRGLGTPLIIIDGVPRNNMERIDSEDIESISVLKDAAAAIYGVKAANGVVLITTKSGSDTGGKVSLSYNGNYTWQYVAGLPKTVGAVDLMLMDNERGMNNSLGGSWRYSQEEIDAYLNGEKKSEDWCSAVFRKTAPQYSHNVNVSGGNSRTKYFVSAGYKYQDSFIRSGDYNYNRFNVRSNITSDITRNLTMKVSLSGIMDTRNSASTSSSSIIYGMWRQYPTQTIYENNQAPYYSFPDNKMNPVQNMQADQVGYDKNSKKWFQSSASLTYRLPWVPGLSVKGEVSYDYSLVNCKNYKKEFKYYEYDPVNKVYNGTSLNNPSELKRSFSDAGALLFSYSINYDHDFGSHHVGAMLLSEGRKNKGDGFYALRELSLDVDELFAGNTANQVGAMDPNSRYEYANQSFVGRVNYDYDGKYIIEGAFRYDGSSRFASYKRWGFFPSVSAAYRISQEKFWRENKVLSTINNFKIRASYGVMGDDNALDYQFLSGYTYPATVLNHSGDPIPGGYFFDGIYVNGLASAGVPNKKITWYEARTMNIGLDVQAWKGMAGLTVDIFKRDRSGLLATSNTVLPGTVGAALPQENLNSDRTFGYEIELSHENHVGDLFYSLKGNFSITRTMIRYRQHADYRSAWENWKSNKSDRYTNIWWGYGYGGQYSSWNDIAEFPVHTSRGLLPGDYYYEDWNGDGFIDSSDIHPIGYDSEPLINFGLDMDFSFKGFDLNVLFQGAAMSNVAYTGQLNQPLYAGKATPLTMFLDRWRPADPHADPFDEFTAWIPGKFAMMGSSVPEENSKANMYNSSYLRLKNIELGYTLPKKIVGKVGIQNLRVFVNAYNILTFSALKFVDPEHPSSDSYMYPLNRTVSLGVNCKF